MVISVVASLPEEDCGRPLFWYRSTVFLITRRVRSHTPSITALEATHCRFPGAAHRTGDICLHSLALVSNAARQLPALLKSRRAWELVSVSGRRLMWTHLAQSPGKN